MQPEDLGPDVSAQVRDCPERLFGVSTPDPIEHDGIAWPDRNPSHLLVQPENEMYARVDWTLDCIEDIFSFDYPEGWVEQKPFLGRLIQQMCHEASDAPVSLSVVNFRESFDRRFSPRSAVETSQTVEPIQHRAAISEMPKTTLNLGGGIGEFPLEDVRLAYDRKVCKDAPALIEQVRTRMMRTENGLRHQAIDRCFFLAHHRGDAEVVARGHIPSMQPYYNRELGVSMMCSLVLAKFPQDRDGDVAQIAIAFQPHDGAICSITSGGKSIEAFLIQHPLEERLLNKAVMQ